jgi:hypothetical protein
MNPSSIKKIINKKVTVIVPNDHLPVKKPHSPIISKKLVNSELFLIRIKILHTMRHRDYHHSVKMERQPRLGTGLFFILLGVALLIATNDLLHLGSISNYFTWQTALIFIGLLLVLNLHLTGGLLMIAAGVWFLLDDFFIITPEIVKTIYWPAVIVLIGLSFILSSVFKLKN